MKALLLEGTVAERIPSSTELVEAAKLAQIRLGAGDRAGAYLELYKVTGNEQLLIQAQITTYSGTFGGAAIEGNFRAKIANPEKYDLTLDKFSHEIDQAVVKLAEHWAERGKPNEFNTRNILEVDKAVWAGHFMTDDFPGNAFWVNIDDSIATSEGGVQAILAMDEIELGRRPAEYANNPNYTIHTSNDDRFITVVNKETQRIECFFDKKLDSDVGTKIDKWFIADLEQVKNAVPEGRVLAERQLKMQFLQAGTLAPIENLPTFIANNPVPPANLDRVFEHNGKLYQANDRKTLEAAGVNFQGMLKGNIVDGMAFATKLGYKGLSTDELSKNFSELNKKGLIEPLSDSEKIYYHNALKNLQQEGLPSPYQSMSQAFRNVSVNMVTEQEREPAVVATQTVRDPYLTSNNPRLQACIDNMLESFKRPETTVRVCEQPTTTANAKMSSIQWANNIYQQLKAEQRAASLQANTAAPLLHQNTSAPPTEYDPYAEAIEESNKKQQISSASLKKGIDDDFDLG